MTAPAAKLFPSLKRHNGSGNGAEKMSVLELS